MPHDIPSAPTLPEQQGQHANDPQGVTITVTPGGPYLVRGPVTIVTHDGAVLTNERATVALCRCGATGRSPFCDGSHRVCATPPPDVDPERVSRP